MARDRPRKPDTEDTRTDPDEPAHALTAKLRAFVREYLLDSKGTQAAVRVGYSKHSAEVAASKLLRAYFGRSEWSQVVMPEGMVKSRTVCSWFGGGGGGMLLGGITQWRRPSRSAGLRSTRARRRAGLEGRYRLSSTVVTSQLEPKDWHAVIGDATLADAILDCLVHNAHRIKLGGGSIRYAETNLTKGRKQAKG
ncbi:IS21 family transposition helper protein [Myxococcus stipitatus DSM 14675]|uniref:IS21 family transposition helper protein n=1 Tax=Myxococcus stipitatus (strain DSM 14675 / JCM 12634 / Mx s8) TaxID=1278073 RepID=L7UKI0_MYXSD|nr:IS21 family transposition helper protein [Myxococcus stipitatus DSM 14675]